jgi:hypothetical protein
MVCAALTSSLKTSSTRLHDLQSSLSVLHFDWCARHAQSAQRRRRLGFVAVTGPMVPRVVDLRDGQARCATSTPEPNWMSTSLVSRSSSPPTTAVMTATKIGYQSPL